MVHAEWVFAVSYSEHTWRPLGIDTSPNTSMNQVVGKAQKLLAKRTDHDRQLSICQRWDESGRAEWVHLLLFQKPTGAPRSAQLKKRRLAVDNTKSALVEEGLDKAQCKWGGDHGR